MHCVVIRHFSSKAVFCKLRISFVPSNEACCEKQVTKKDNNHFTLVHKLTSFTSFFTEDEVFFTQLSCFNIGTHHRKKEISVQKNSF